jgi:hypothetical protein
MSRFVAATTRTSIGTLVTGEYDVHAGMVTLEVQTAAGLAVLDIDTRRAREIQIVLDELLGPPLTARRSARATVPFTVETVAGSAIAALATGVSLPTPAPVRRTGTFAWDPDR